MTGGLRGLLLVLIAGVSPVYMSSRGLCAENQFGSNCSVQSSPFYQKLVNAGVFEAPFAELEHPKPVSLLFRMASSFHYNSDGLQKDRWQSADETQKSYRGDCEDKAIWLYTQMRLNGYHDTSLHIGRYASDSKKFHMWVSYKDGAGKTMLLDPTNQRKPWPAQTFPKESYQNSHVISGENCVSY